MIFTRIAWVLGLALFAGMCWLAVDGFAPIVPFLVTAIALFVLVGGGNLIQGRSPFPGGRRGQPTSGPKGPEGSE